MTLRQEFEERERQWRRFHEWEAQLPPIERSPAAIIADLGAILNWIPKQARLEDPDPQKTGVRKMHAALSLWKRG